MEITQTETKAAIYIRVSTAEQAMHGKSLRAQKEFLEDYAAKHDMKIAGIFADEGQTARKELKKRKAIHALLEHVKRSEIDVILFWKMDRWFRSVSDFYKVQDILDKYNVKWIAAAEPNMNMDTRDGRLNLNIMLSIGQNEVDTTSERIKFTVDNMIQNGRLVWGDLNLPMGYRIETTNGSKQISKDPETEDMVTDFFTYFQTHQNKRQTVLYMQETYGIPFSYSMLRTMLGSEFYMGKYRNNQNYCPAYLSYEEWSRIQKISKRNIRTTRSDRIYLFSSLIRCPVCHTKLCGTGCSIMINHKTRAKKTYCYYRCNKAMTDGLCTNRHRLSQKLVESRLLSGLEKKYVLFQLQYQKIYDRTPAKNRNRTRDKIQTEMDRLNLMFQKDRISPEHYECEYDKLQNELALLHSAPSVKNDYSHIEQLLNGDFETMYHSLKEENRQAFWHSILEEIVIDESGNIISVKFLL